MPVLTLLGNNSGGQFCDGLSRRSFVQIGGLGLGGISLQEVLRAQSNAPVKTSEKSVIMIYLPGGPTHLDTVDMRPHAPQEIRGPFSPIQTAVPGIQICELLPMLAKNVDKMVLIRSLVGGQNRHESFQCYTGRPGGRPGDNEPAGGWPTFGAVISKLQGPGPGRVPAYLDAGPKMGYVPYNNMGGHDGPFKPSWPGFTGIRHTPFQLNGEGKDDLVLSSVSADRLDSRKRLLDSFDQYRRGIDSTLRETDQESDPFREQALGILTSSKLAEALDLEKEPASVRQRYGSGGPTTPSFGGAPKSPQHFLLARRLVEAGVRCVTVAFGAWDWHANRGGPLSKLASEDLPMFDQALSALIEDLGDRGLLERVSIVVWGEFGRTPRINAKGGRDHWPEVGCCLLAGGGMSTGQVVGSTTKWGERARSRPVHFQDVFATLYHNMGIDTKTATVQDLTGRPRYLVENGNYTPIAEII